MFALCALRSYLTPGQVHLEAGFLRVPPGHILSRLAAGVRALKRDWEGLTVAHSDIGCGRALLSDGCNWAMRCSAAHPSGGGS